MPATEARYVKGLAEVVSVEADSIAIRLTDGSLAGQVTTAASGPDTEYAVGPRAASPQSSQRE
jgi:hypothetical protein